MTPEDYERGEKFVDALMQPTAALCVHPDDVGTLNDHRLAPLLREVALARSRVGMQPVRIITNHFMQRGELFAVPKTRYTLEEMTRPSFKFTDTSKDGVAHE